MKREDKKQVVADLNAVFQKAGLVVVALNKGLTMAETTELRNAVRADGASYRVSKNRLTKLALENTPCADMVDYLTGPTALAYSDDAISAARAVAKMAKANDHLEIVGGVMDGKKIDAAMVYSLASLPSLDELRGKLVGLIQAPAAGLARLAKAYAEKEQNV